MSNQPDHQCARGCEEHRCPICGDDAPPLLTPAEVYLLALAVQYGSETAVDDQLINQVLNLMISVRLKARALEMTLAGRLLPGEVTATGDIRWHETADQLPADEADQYHAELAQVRADSGATVEETLLTSSERELLTLAALASPEGDFTDYEQVEAVIGWAETVCAAEQQLQSILTGQLLPAFRDEPESPPYLIEAVELPLGRLARYRQALAELEAAAPAELALKQA